MLMMLLLLLLLMTATTQRACALLTARDPIEMRKRLISPAVDGSNYIRLTHYGYLVFDFIFSPCFSFLGRALD